ncbi:DrmB family protein [Streptomyces sp. NPDC088729]|uniref:DrmB family protein n=1 Tax=Streptomyces sp. NPDC088729 TaxID=3365876 RepID=UPI0037F15510
MTPPPARRRRAGAPERSYPRRGSVRRAQMITTYGVGSMVAVDNESFMVAGTDSWNISEAPTISEHRLARALGVKSFRLPPASDETSKDGVHVRRFPLWHSCPKCETLQHVRRFNSPPGKNECGDCEEDLVPSRFVMACGRGHIDDFPYWKWAHRGNRQEGDSGFCGGEMRLRTSGKTASLRSILVSCTCDVPEVSMEGAFSATALSGLKVFCSGKRPWLKDAPTDPCSERPRTLQRGSSVAWQPIVRTALSIPPYSEEHFTKLGAHLDDLRAMYERRDEHGIGVYLKVLGIERNYEFSAAKVIALLATENQEDAGSDGNVTVDGAFVRLRKQEYERLVEGRPESESDRQDHFVCEHPLSPADVLTPYGVTGPMLVKRLREVRALKSFSRVDTPETRTDVHEAALSLKELDWLPAMEVQGEGVFLRLDEQRLDSWARNAAVAARADRIRDNHARMLRERAQDSSTVPDSPASPRMILLHTLAHALINEWSLDGGYPAASLRERLYASEPMAGILICTATSDSAGSLGGLVAQGEPNRLKESLDSALDRARWCSADPLCVESEGSGVGGINMAACHACVLLPETSCEHNNGMLDRALLIGTPENPSIGFFSDALSS